ncbi:MAG TPA: rRNA maturation RNAse YbeY, partial [Bacillota bacterium]|nr:rRNA maturation RNAse YbeY [Bacillota bacterium]
HGALHLLGYDHEDDKDKAEMRLAEEDVLSGMGMTR